MKLIKSSVFQTAFVHLFKKGLAGGKLTPFIFISRFLFIPLVPYNMVFPLSIFQVLLKGNVFHFQWYIRRLG